MRRPVSARAQRLLFPEDSNPPDGDLRANPETVMQSAHASYARGVPAVNSAAAVRTLEATFFLALATCEEMDKSQGPLERCRLSAREVPGEHHARPRTPV